MTLSVFKNIFEAEYLLETQKRGVVPIDYTDGQLALWISQAQQDIVDRLNLLVTYSDVAYTAGATFSTSSLPSNFGKLVKAEINGKPLNVINIAGMPSNGTLDTGLPETCAVYDNGTNRLIALSPVPNTSGTVRVWYVINTLFHDGTTNTAQDWGTYSTATQAGFSGSLKIPDRYIPFMTLYILGKFFDEKMGEYEARIRQARGNDSQTFNLDLTYNLGGVTN